MLPVVPELFHCVKSVQIRSFFWSALSRIWTVRIWQNTDQKKLRNWTLSTQWFLSSNIILRMMSCIIADNTYLFILAERWWKLRADSQGRWYPSELCSEAKFIGEIDMEVRITKTYSENKFQEDILPENRTATESTITESIQWWWWWWWALLFLKNQVLQSRIALVYIL